jgi:hypothetical protein
MDSGSLAAITSSVLETLLAAAGTSIGRRSLTGVGHWKDRRERLNQHIRNVTQDVSVFTTYWPAAQPIEDAFVQPRLIDGALSQLYLDPIDLKLVLEKAMPRGREAL